MWKLKGIHFPAKIYSNFQHFSGLLFAWKIASWLTTGVLKIKPPPLKVRIGQFFFWRFYFCQKFTEFVVNFLIFANFGARFLALFPCKTAQNPIFFWRASRANFWRFYFCQKSSKFSKGGFYLGRGFYFWHPGTRFIRFNNDQPPRF